MAKRDAVVAETDPAKLAARVARLEARNAELRAKVRSQSDEFNRCYAESIDDSQEYVATRKLVRLLYDELTARGAGDEYASLVRAMDEFTLRTELYRGTGSD